MAFTVFIKRFYILVSKSYINTMLLKVIGGPAHFFGRHLLSSFSTAKSILYLLPPNVNGYLKNFSLLKCFSLKFG